jgi:hypothetical protein
MVIVKCDKFRRQVLDSANIVGKILYGCPERRIWSRFQIPVDQIVQEHTEFNYEKEIENGVVAVNYGVLKLSWILCNFFGNSP